MTATLTTNQDINNITQLYDDIVSSTNSYYFFVARPTPWANGDTAPAVTLNTYEETEQSIYHDLMFGKKLGATNLSYLIPYIPWVANTLYTEYDNQNSTSRTSYTVTADYSVYKCIDNNYGALSTIQPSLKSTTGVFQTSDGYTWKYMFTITPSANNLFSSASFVPVVANTIVANNAIPGTIDIIRVPVAGTGYHGTTNGYVVSLTSWNSLVINNSASTVNDIYTGSSIYLKGGLGGDQIRLITGYNGSSQQVTVAPAFATFVNLSFNSGSVTGSFNVGDQVVQIIDYLAYINKVGILNQGDLLMQTDTGAQATILHANDVVVSAVSANVSVPAFQLNYPVIDLSDSPTAMTGTVTINASSNVVYGANSTNSLTANLLNYSVGNYIQVGVNTNTNVRLITSITNSSFMNVSNNFNNTLMANVNAKILNAFVPTSIAALNCNGQVIDTNLSSVKLIYANQSSAALNYIVGETVKEYDVNGIDQSSNATVAYSNSTTLILSNVQGSIQAGLFLTGQSSELTAQTVSILSYPNITLDNAIGNFIVGAPVYALTANGSTAGSANVNSFTYSPSSTTQYIISPTVNITGDGNGALAYSIVNTSSSSYGIEDIVIVNPGSGYSNATATISANSLWGNGALLSPVVSPVYGHGANAVLELGANYLGINMLIDTGVNESYYFPTYGSYRRVGILRNPLFYELWVNTAINYETRYNLITEQVYGNFTNNEIVFQPSTNSAAVVVSSNNTFLQIKNLNGNLTSNVVNTAVNNLIVGLASNALANVVSFTTSGFILNTNNQVIRQIGTMSNGNLMEVVSNSQVILTNVSGTFSTNTVIYDSTTNSYANVTGLYGGNSYVNMTTTFGNRFSQTTRLTLDQYSTIPFQLYEYVTQETSNAYGQIIDLTHESDIVMLPISGTFSAGISANGNISGANGIITFANSSYLKMTCVQGSFVNSEIISCISGNAQITTVLPVLLLADISPVESFETSYSLIVTGSNSGAQGYSTIANNITYPNLTRNSGQVLYISDLAPFTLNVASQETFNLVLQM